jgi:hypothetical protein
MKTLALLICVVAGTVVSQSQTNESSAMPNPQYFSTGYFDTPHSFRDRWYSSTLCALQEPSLFALRNGKSIQVYRFLWLPSFHRPISVRLTINADGTGSVITRTVDSHAGLLTKPASDTGKPMQDRTIVIDHAQIKEVLGQLQHLAFWSMPTEEEQTAPRSLGATSGGRTFRQLIADGSHWIFEGLRDGEYHAVDRVSPDDNSYSRLCKYLFRLGKVEATPY